MPKDQNIRDYLDGNELDLSLHNLTSVPVKELVSIPKATHLDLSCNQLTCLPTTFCSLTHIVKIDLSKNHLTDLPDNFGNLCNLQHLDLLGNQLVRLPVSFGQLQKLKWLDLKDNPLELELKKTAGDCLDERECRMCAQKVLVYMKNIEDDIERKRKKKEAAKREREKAKKLQEEKEREQKKKEKQAEKAKRRQEYEVQKAANNPVLIEKKPEEPTEEAALVNGYPTDQKPATSGRSACKSFLSWLLFVVVLLLAVIIGISYFCEEAGKKNVYCKTYWQPSKQMANQYTTVYWKPAKNFIRKMYDTVCLQFKEIMDNFTDSPTSDHDSFAKVPKDSDSVK